MMISLGDPALNAAQPLFVGKPECLYLLMTEPAPTLRDMLAAYCCRVIKRKKRPKFTPSNLSMHLHMYTQIHAAGVCLSPRPLPVLLPIQSCLLDKRVEHTATRNQVRRRAELGHRAFV